jgi:hypothetical protein
MNARLSARDNNSTTESPKASFDVYWHVIAANQTYDGGWIPDEHIQAQMKVLNEDFNSTGVSWNYKNTTRVVSSEWFFNVAHTPQEKIMKKLFKRGDQRALNIYTIGFNATTKTLGYTSLPHNYTRAPWYDGIVLRYTVLPGGSKVNYNGGRTLTHEAGHWLGLLHTFEGGCSGPGDGVDDTPAEASSGVGCPVGRDTCKDDPGEDPIHNFMDYTYDSCMTEFTPGQARKIHESIRTYRTPANASSSS